MKDSKVKQDLIDYDEYLNGHLERNLIYSNSPSVEMKLSFKEMFGYEVCINENGLTSMKYENKTKYTI